MLCSEKPEQREGDHTDTAGHQGCHQGNGKPNGDLCSAVKHAAPGRALEGTITPWNIAACKAPAAEIARSRCESLARGPTLTTDFGC